MVEATETESRKLLQRLREAMASDEPGQARLDRITHLIADSMGTEVCSIYLFRDKDTLELCATEGLKAESVHQTRLRVGEGLVGRVAKSAAAVNTADAPSENVHAPAPPLANPANERAPQPAPSASAGMGQRRIAVASPTAATAFKPKSLLQ